MSSLSARGLSFSFLACIVTSFALLHATALHAATGTEERSGLRCISSKAFPVPQGSQSIAACDFEADGKLPPGWGQGNAEVISTDDAPQGKAWFRMKAKKNAGLRSPVITAQPGVPYFLSFWVRTPVEPWTAITFTSDEREPSFTTIHSPFFYADFPLDTGDQWRQEGYFFVMPPQCQTLQININPKEDAADGQFVSLDDVRLRTATEAEMSAAYEAERAHLPPYELTQRAGDGKNLALSVAKWEGRAGIPGKPFVIWALGSSFTDRQGDGYELIQAIRQRFPHAPPIIYRKHGGPGTPWEYVHGWIKQFIAAEQPDLIFTYTSGTLEGLDAMLAEIRQRTTAEVIVPSLHFRPPPDTMTENDIENGMGVAWAKVREICAKHGAEFVENRREMAHYIPRNGLQMDDLLVDHNHQNKHGLIRIWDNVSRHLAKSDQSDYKPESRERRIAVAPPANTQTEQVTLTGSWTNANGTVHSNAAGNRLKITFTGNRLDVIGRKSPSGGTAKVLIDGTPADQAPVFLMNYIKPDKKNWRIPHAVDLGSHPVPQTWTITMTSNVGDFSLTGSSTGPDGAGNLATAFRSTSGQIALDPKFWRQGRVEKKDQMVEYGVAKDETFAFDVFRSAVAELSFKVAEPAPLIEALVRNLPNQEHSLELITTGDGEVVIERLYVFQPPEK